MATVLTGSVAPSDDATAASNPDDQDSQPPNKPTRVARKRTKTGCLTCRKRRIKCDETQPTCRNCHKSRRLCHYTKYTFKDQPGVPSSSAPLDQTHSAPQGVDFMFAFSSVQGQVAGLNGGMTNDPTTSQPTQHNLAPPFAPLRPGVGSASAAYDSYSFEVQPMYNSQPFNPFAVTTQGFSGAPAVWDTNTSAGHDTTELPLHLASHHDPPHEPYPSTSYPTALGLDTSLQSPLAPVHTQRLFSPSDSSPRSAFPNSARDDFDSSNQAFSPYESSPGYGNPFVTSQLPEGFLGGHPASNADDPQRASAVSGSSAGPQRGFMMLSRAFDNGIYNELAHRGRALQSASASRYTPEQIRDVSEALENAAVEAEDDEYFDVLSEEEEAIHAMYSMHTTPPPDIQIMQSLYHHSGLLRQRGIHAFIYPGIMDHYRAERVASPLKNDATARVFAHFVSSTGPMLSPFERVPRVNPTLVELGAMPTSHLSLWTFTLPMHALHHQGLLHAMLAMSSLHIARLQGASITPSYRHYSWSVRRVHKAVSNGQGHQGVAILAATLLLAFYEVMTADLIKWIPHLCGARQLILATDFVGLAEQIAARQAERALLRQSQPFGEQTKDPFIDSFPNIDIQFVHELAGKRWQKQCATDQVPLSPSVRRYTTLELSNFEVLQDLYWWYLKQDMVQSAISGDPPLMHYSHWTRCPPRAPLGLRDAVHGSFDHVLLVIGRICDFAARDVLRKERWNEANGQPWPPCAFHGMAPASAVYMPRAFGSETKQMTPLEAEQNVGDLQAHTERALLEWADIEAAFDKLERAIAVPGYMPLAEDEIGHYNTPFGRVVHYSSYNLAVLHMFVHMGRLMLSRCHPDMPPALSMAVGAAAAITAPRAALIGRIAAGVTPLLSTTANLSPQLAGTFTDCTMPLFFAGVQYSDPAQRYWTVTRLHEIEERSGWASAGLCADGCEREWERAARNGVGLPYTRIRPNPGEISPDLAREAKGKDKVREFD